MNPSPRAFTLVELIVVIMIVAMLSGTIAVTFSAGREKAEFRDHQNQIINIYQRGRTLALSNKKTDTGNPDYYHVNLATGSIYLEGVDLNGTSTLIHQFDFAPEIAVDNNFDVYYYSPLGTACFTLGCPGGTDIMVFNLDSENYSAQIGVFWESGFPELMSGDL